jgi:hypothetical protein
VEETGVPGENNSPDASHCQSISHNFVASAPRHDRDLDNFSSIDAFEIVITIRVILSINKLWQIHKNVVSIDKYVTYNSMVSDLRQVRFALYIFYRFLDTGFFKPLV